MLLDAHQHFWRFDPVRDAWITEAMGPLRRDFLPEHLAPHLAAAGVDGTVAVQADPSEAETQFLLDLSDAHPFVRGVVGWVDLRAADVADRLAHFARHPRFRGVRHLVQAEPMAANPADDFLLREDFGRGIAALGRFGLTYDLLIYPPRLAVAETLVGRFPDQPFVLDHLAKPYIAAGRIDAWARDLRALARHENVCAKLSGLVTEADWQAWTPADVAPYLDVALEAFGADRLMFGSDWPVCLLAADYAAAFDLVADYAGRLSDVERAAILGGTAAAFYGL